jgi:hypothetical protein
MKPESGGPQPTIQRLADEIGQIAAALPPSRKIQAQVTAISQIIVRAAAIQNQAMKLLEIASRYMPPDESPGPKPLLDVAKEIRSEFTDDNGAYKPQIDSDGEKWPNEQLFRKLEKVIEETEAFMGPATQS